MMYATPKYTLYKNLKGAKTQNIADKCTGKEGN